jgi:cell division protein FtsL
MNRIIFIVLILLISSAWGIVYDQNKLRKLYIQLEKEKTEVQNLKTDLERRKLECSMLDNKNRIDDFNQEAKKKETKTKN